MTERRGSRFLLEVLFLLALTAALTLANLQPLEIAGIMLIGWVIVAVLEWVAWREEPHYGSGLPPRYYVPQVNLPPAQPLEAVSAGYHEAHDEAPTWIASPALRAEMLGAEPHGEWPVAAPPVSQPLQEPRAEERQAEEQHPEVVPDPWTHPEQLPAAPLGELAPEPEPLAEAREPDPVFIPPPVSVVVESSRALEPEPVAEQEVEPEPEPSLDVELVRSAQGVARYSLDPLGDVQPRRRFSRGGAPEPAGVEVPARPEGLRALPRRTNRQD